MVSQANAVTSGGHRVDIGIVARDPESRIFLSGVVYNNPNVARGWQDAGLVQIWWHPGGNEGARQLITQVAANMWVDRQLSYYWGTDACYGCDRARPGYHVFSIQVNGGQGDGSYLSVIELSR